MKAIIMAGGKGTRLAPLTYNVPKPMVKVLDEPLINYTVKLLNLYGINDIGVTLQYMPEKIIDGLTKSFSNKFHFFIEERPLGTAGSVKNARDFVSDEPVLIISGDALTNIDIKAMFSEHIKSKAPVTMAVQTSATPWLYGVVVPDDSGNIEKFQEKPQKGSEASDLVNCGIYILNPEVLDLIPIDTEYDFSKDLFFDMLKNNIPIHVFRNDAYWCDIGNIAAYHRANMDMLYGVKGLEVFTNDKKIVYDKSRAVFVANRVDVDFEVKLFGGVVLGEGVNVWGNSLLSNCVLCDGAVIQGEHIFDSVVTPAHRLSVSMPAFMDITHAQRSGQRQPVVN